MNDFVSRDDFFRTTKSLQLDCRTNNITAALKSKVLPEVVGQKKGRKKKTWKNTHELPKQCKCTYVRVADSAFTRKREIEL